MEPSCENLSLAEICLDFDKAEFMSLKFCEILIALHVVAIIAIILDILSPVSHNLHGCVRSDY